MSDVILRYGQNPAFTRRRRWMRPERLDCRCRAQRGVTRSSSGIEFNVARDVSTVRIEHHGDELVLLTGLASLRQPVPHASVENRAVALKITRLDDVRVSIEPVMTPMLAKIALKAQNHHGDVTSARVSAQQIEDAQSTDDAHFRAQQDQPWQFWYAPRKCPHAEQILQSLVAAQQVKDAGSWCDLFQRDEGLVSVQRAIIDDQDVMTGSHVASRS